jgi:hypothetical protein
MHTAVRKRMCGAIPFAVGLHLMTPDVMFPHPRELHQGKQVAFFRPALYL